jgi:L-2-hydroxyglutarate oxidase
MAFLNPGADIVLIEREKEMALHASGRNTGKVHAPYLYDPDKKGLFARAALAGYSMWEEYAHAKGLPFRDDGVIEVALDSGQATTLEKYRRWGIRNGLVEDDLTILDGRDLHRTEPEVRCHAALVCSRDASVDYRSLTSHLVRDAVSAGAEFLPGHDATTLAVAGDRVRITLNRVGSLEADFVVNAAGGRSMEVAHKMGIATDYTDVYFRGEYWRAPPAYRALTSKSVYSVPSNPRYPFLDPHWIVRVDGSCEVGPNAVPVFSPYGYDAASNARSMLPKVMEMLGSGARRTAMDPEFQRMVVGEIQSSLSKRSMIGRVRRFIPRLDPARFIRRGTAGIRSLAVDAGGAFVPDVMVMEGPHSLHILNYNSPGATGALPFAAHIIRTAVDTGLCRNVLEDAACGPWRFGEVAHTV